MVTLESPNGHFGAAWTKFYINSAEWAMLVLPSPHFKPVFVHHHCACVCEFNPQS